MQYWKLHVVPCKNGEYDVFYKTPLSISIGNVARNAVIDGDLLSCFMPFVRKIEQISPEIYFEHMHE